jgi:ferredoxin-NADP reductase
MAELERGIEYEDTLVVTGKRTEADGLVSLELQRPDGGRLPDWTPGAHIDLILPNGATRQYSLCGDPRDWRRYRVGVLRESDSHGGSSYIHENLEVGHEVSFGGPRNNFAVVPSPRFSFIAGGVGITPILPMLRMADQLGADWHLLYLGRSRKTMAFLDELGDWPDRVEVHLPTTAGAPTSRAGFLQPPTTASSTCADRRGCWTQSKSRPASGGADGFAWKDSRRASRPPQCERPRSSWSCGSRVWSSLCNRTRRSPLRSAQRE